MTTPLERNQITLADLTPAQQGALANLRRSPSGAYAMAGAGKAMRTASP